MLKYNFRCQCSMLLFTHLFFFLEIISRQLQQKVGRIYEIRIAYIHFLRILGRLRLFLGFGKKNKDMKAKRCAVCSRELKRHKYKPSPDWNIEGLLCSDCHFEKTRDFIINA